MARIQADAAAEAEKRLGETAKSDELAEGTDGEAFTSAAEDCGGSDADMEGEGSDEAVARELERSIDRVVRQRDQLKALDGDHGPAYIRAALAGAERELAGLRAQRTAKLSPVSLAHKVGNELDRCQRKVNAAAQALET